MEHAIQLPEYTSSNSMAQLDSNQDPKIPALPRTADHTHPLDSAISPFCIQKVNCPECMFILKLNRLTRINFYSPVIV